MGREIRRVPADWQHPTDGFYRDGKVRHVPLLGGSYAEEAARWDEDAAKWAEGFVEDYANGGWKPRESDNRSETYADWSGGRPEEKDYMPDWPAEQRTHLMMYETTSEGTPISPAFETPEELARWLADNNASAFGDLGATYEEWLATCRSGWAPSAVFTSGAGLVSGVEAMTDLARPTPDNGGDRR